MFNVECSMLNGSAAEGGPSAIQHSTFNIQHSTFRFSRMTLFDTAPFDPPAKSDAPLPERVRPRTLEDVVGLDELLGEGRFLRTAIESDRIPSMIFWGPPGSGKTTMARIIANKTQARFVTF